MKKLILSVLAVIGVGAMVPTEADVQMYIIKDGKVKVALDHTPEYITFENPMLCGGVVGEAVDMGLSVKWSSWNVGASKPEEYGDYYAWGETASKEKYDFSTYTVEDANFIGDHKTVLEAADDAAAANWQGGWVMPTAEDWQELYDNCDSEWTSDYKGDGSNKAGYIFKSKKVGNTNSIFLPAAPPRLGSSLSQKGCGFYWSSSLGEFDSSYGRSVYFYSDEFGTYDSYYRFRGQSVRPVCPAQGITNGHDAVDLGLPSGKLWATCNVGASAPEESGSYFAWGETEVKSDYSWSTYKHMQSGQSEWKYINKYQISDCQFEGIWYNGGKYKNDGGKTVLDAADDLATQSWGEEWRMPTIAEWQELYNNTTREWTDDYNGTGVKGYILTSTKEGHTDASIFLPAAGCRDGSGLYDGGSYGCYWSSSLYESRSSLGRCVYFRSGLFYTYDGNYRCYGQSVRPVCLAQNQR